MFKALNKRANRGDLQVSAAVSIAGIQAVNANLQIAGRDQYSIYPGRSEEAEIYQWLAATIPSVNYEGARAKRLHNTGGWFFGGKRFLRWKATPDDFLWVHGTPGSGKTILSAATVEEVTRYCEANPIFACGYFFFDGRDGQKELQQLSNLIRSLIRQLSSRCGGIPPPLKALYDHCHNGGSQPSIAALQTTLLDILSLFHQVYIIVDSLDECTERKEILNWIEQITSWKAGKLHLLITSRNEVPVTDRLQRVDPDNILMTSQLVHADIEAYVNHMLKTTLSDQWDEEIQQKIKDNLLSRADGMFRLISLQIDELQNCFSDEDLEEQMNTLPSGLDEFYDLIVSKIDNKHRGHVLKFLQWLAFSARPLRLEELAQITGVVTEHGRPPRFKPSRVYRDPQSVMRVCSSLVTYTDGTIKLAHMSVKEYLLNPNDRHGTPGFTIDEKHSHSLIAETCLTYLLQFEDEDILNSETAQKFPLADYAAKYWIFHAKSGCLKGPELNLITTLLHPSPTLPFLTWVWLFNVDTKQSLDLSEGVPPPLYYASLAGLVPAVSWLLKNDADPNATGGRFCNALQAAAAKGHEGIVKLLLQNGAEPNLYGGVCHTPLFAASQRGHLGIVQLLLDNEANVNAHSDFHGSALQVASFKGHQEIVQLLLKHNAEANAQPGYYGTALYAAAGEGHEAIVNLLLGYGADVNAKGGIYGTAFQAASSRGHKGIVKLLLERNPEIKTSRRKYGGILHPALVNDHEEIVGSLRLMGADVNERGGLYDKALEAATWQGGKGSVKQALERLARRQSNDDGDGDGSGHEQGNEDGQHQDKPVNIILVESH